jgi:hypothetical protein
VLTPEGLWQEGVSYRGPTTDPLGRVKKHELRLGRAESLASLQKEYVFFTPALLYVLSVVDDRPLCDLMWELGRDIPIYFKKFTWPMFRRLETADGDTAWNHALWAVRPDHWDYLLDFYCSMAIRNHERKQLYRVAAQDVLVVDPLVVEAKGLLLGSAATLQVTAFGVNGTKFVAAFQQYPDPMLDPPRLRLYPPDEKTQVFARALARGDNPHVAVDLYLEDMKQKERARGKA